MSNARAGWPRWAWGLVALVALLSTGLAIYGLRSVLTPIFFAFLIAYFLDPLVDRFEARGLPRALGIVIVLALGIVAAALVLLLVVPGVVHEVGVFASELPGRVDHLRQALEPRLAEYGVEVPHSFAELRALVGLDAVPDGAASVLGGIAAWMWGSTSSAFAVAGTLFLVPVFAFYLLDDFDRMTAGARDLVPARYRPFVVDVGREIDQVLGQFVRGQLLVMLILSVLYALGYWMVGVRLAIPIGIVAGLLSFIPYVGGASALLLALMMCALGWQGWGQVAGVVVVYSIIQTLEGFVITPRIVGDKVGLPAIWVLVALMIGGELFGFLGVLLALPGAAVTKIFVVRALAYYRSTPLYTEEAEPEGGALLGILTEEGLPDPDALAAAKRATGVDDVRSDAVSDAAPVDDEDAPADLEQAISAALASIPPPEPDDPDPDDAEPDDADPDEANEADHETDDAEHADPDEADDTTDAPAAVDEAADEPEDPEDR